MERVFFVDYENVDTGGLDGLTRLIQNDTVIIYYSERHSRLTFGLHRRIMDSVANIQYKKIKDNSKDALDYELMEDANEMITDTRADYYIISKDRGYESFIKEKRGSGYRVFLLPDINECNKVKLAWLQDTIRDRLVEEKPGNERIYILSDEEIEQIAKWLLDSKSKQVLNIHLQEMFKTGEIHYIFTRLRDLTYNL